MGFLAFVGVSFIALLGTPLFIVMGLGAIVAFTLSDEKLVAIAIELYRIADAPTLLTIPLFTFAGYMMAESNSPKRLLKFTEALFGWVPGGIAIVSLVVCAFFTAFTGASGVTIIALGGLLFPILKSEGYSEKFSLGLITTSGSLGLLFPPSLPIILYGLVGKVDIDSLFKAGIVPGILIIVILSLWSIKNAGEKKTRIDFSLTRLVQETKNSFLEVLMPIGVLVGIYGGFTTPSEAAAITCFYVFIMEFFIYKDLSLKNDFARITKDSMSLVGAILLILCCALGLTNWLVDEEIPLQIFEVMKII